MAEGLGGMRAMTAEERAEFNALDSFKPTPLILVQRSSVEALRGAVKGCGVLLDPSGRAQSDICGRTNRHCVPCRQAMWRAIYELVDGRGL